MHSSSLKSLILGLALAGFWALSAGAGDIPKAKQTKLGLYVSATEAGEMLSDPSVILIDIRTRAEVGFVGIPTRANVHIPYMVMPMMAEYNPEKGAYDLEMNPDFPQDFKDYASKNGIGADTRIVLMCRSGGRSARAANLLADMGFTQIYSLTDGFEGDKAKDGPEKGHRVLNGWKNAGLDWSYKIRADQAYPGD